MRNIAEDTLNRYYTSSQYHMKMAAKVYEFWPEGDKNAALKAAHMKVAKGLAELYAILGVYHCGRKIDELQENTRALADKVGMNVADLNGFEEETD